MHDVSKTMLECLSLLNINFILGESTWQLSDMTAYSMASCDSETATQIKLAIDPNHRDP